MVILGIGLRDLQFLPGLPIPGPEPNIADHPTTFPETGINKNSFLLILQIGLAAGVILLFFFVITAILKKINVKLIILLTGALIISFAIFSVLPTLPYHQFASAPTDTSLPEKQLPVYQIAPIGDPPEKLFFWVKVGLFIAGVFLFGWMIARVLQRNKKGNALADEAETAIQAITNGVNLCGVIIQCYLNMEKVISQERSIDRSVSMTPREFETYLIHKGIPEAPILQLTTMFEKARYGNQCLTERDELDALRCLSAIKQACQSVKEGD